MITLEESSFDVSLAGGWKKFLFIQSHPFNASSLFGLLTSHHCSPCHLQPGSHQPFIGELGGSGCDEGSNHIRCVIAIMGELCQRSQSLGDDELGGGLLIRKGILQLREDFLRSRHVSNETGSSDPDSAAKIKAII